MSRKQMKVHQLRQEHEVFWPWSQKHKHIEFACGTPETTRSIFVGFGLGVDCKHCLKKMDRYKMDLFEQREELK